MVPMSFAPLVQALSEERGEAVQKLTLQVELLTEKVQLLNSEINQQEQEHQHTAQDLQQQLDKAQVRWQLLTATQSQNVNELSVVEDHVSAGCSACGCVQQQQQQHCVVVVLLFC